MSAPIAVIGAGAWGTALAWLLAGKGEQIRLWAFEPEVASGIVASHENKLFLPGVSLPATLEPTTSLAEAVDGVTLVVFVVPSHAAGKVAASLAPRLPAGVPLVTATKGIEPEKLRLISELLEETLPARRGPVFALSGPSFAVEVCRHLPTAVALAGSPGAQAEALQRLLMTPAFRVYLSEDRIGVQLGGALKNVIALAAGVVTDSGSGTTPAPRSSRGAWPRWSVLAWRWAPMRAPSRVSRGSVTLPSPAPEGSAGTGRRGSSSDRGKSSPISSPGRAPWRKGSALPRRRRPSPSATGWRCPSSGRCARCSSRAKIPGAPSPT